MKYFTTTSAASRRASSCIIVGIYERGKLGKAALDIDKASKGFIRNHIKSGDLNGQLGRTFLLTSIDGVKAQRILVVGLGKVSSFGISQFRQATSSAINILKSSKVANLVNYLTLEEVEGINPYYLSRYSIQTVGDMLYRFNKMKSGRQNKSIILKRIGLALRTKSDASKVMLGAKHADAIIAGMNLAKDLGNLPPNICTPSYLARTAQQLTRENKNIQTHVMSEAAMKRLGMHSLLSVTAGTVLPAKLIVMKYKNAPKQDPVVLVGKGVTFDAGGISLKPGHGMDEMKFDMCGAAAVIGTMAVIAKLKLPINVNVVVPTCENLPSGTATRPGDIIKSMSGKTIEILNTDAEGRLILCDAITYSKRFKPAALIDVATLTGACVIALGHHRTAVMSNSDTLANSIIDAGIAADDRGWHMPIADEYERQLKSNFADFANISGREGGAITAACFLSKFTTGIEWAHLDIAGTAWHSGKKKGSTARPVPMLTEFLLKHAGVLP
ncbi:leucyl aminopeptidase [Woeseiaceae bacterium]|nr:leucyl aminopeptidase [Woeseiaceae bacterium]